MKRIFDFTVAALLLALLAPFLGVIALMVWLEDRRSPWFRGMRLGQGAVPFRMLKFRSMRVDAWKSGVNSTSASDARITRVGRWLRRSKLDELPQLWNVLLGDMSLVGPRPQVPSDAALYTSLERRMLLARPGITDLASIVFSDEGEILAGSADPDLLYNQIVRPWKSRLALLYLSRRTFFTDLGVLGLTALALISRERALEGIAAILADWDAEPVLLQMARRQQPLLAYPPPGAAEVVAQYRATSA
jgi:lipopolysaccharide/colanic/teichoic acid biosynthesis glycosyltransferase